MASQFDELLFTTAHDGASAPIGVCSPPPWTEVDELMAAWFRERHECIEMKLFLEEASRIMRRILNDGALTASSKRRIHRLIRAMQEARAGEGMSGVGEASESPF